MPEHYWIYDDPTTNHARVHKHDCGYCNDGTGTGVRPPGPGPDGDEWIGPFDTREIAFQRMRERGREDARGCRWCRP